MKNKTPFELLRGSIEEQDALTALRKAVALVEVDLMVAELEAQAAQARAEDLERQLSYYEDGEPVGFGVEPAPERTCQDFGGEDGTNGEFYDFACSACGYCCDLPDPSYCPNCGARVIEEAQ